MSGGSYNYACHRLEALAHDIRRVGDCDAAPPQVRGAFVGLLLKCAAAMKAIEWNDSGDGASDEEALIRACLSDGAPLAALIEEANDTMKRMRAELERANRRA